MSVAHGSALVPKSRSPVGASASSIEGRRFRRGEKLSAEPPRGRRPSGASPNVASQERVKSPTTSLYPLSGLFTDRSVSRALGVDAALTLGVMARDRVANLLGDPCGPIRRRPSGRTGSCLQRPQAHQLG